MKLRNLRDHYQAAVSRTNKNRETDVIRFYDNFTEGLLNGDIDPSSYSLAEAFDLFVQDGFSLRQEFNPNKRVNPFRSDLLENANVISTTAFTNITGQIVYSMILQSFASEQYIGDQLCETVPTQFDGEKIPGVSLIGNKAAVVPEGAPYPTAGISEYWVDTPNTIKRGLILGVTQEAIFFDRTSLVQKNASEVGQTIMISKENRILDGALGITTLYRRNGAAAVATYGDTPFDNLAASNSLVDYTDIENCDLLFEDMTDPITGEPISVVPDSIIYPGALSKTVNRILNATEVRQGTYNGTPVTVSGSPLTNASTLNRITSPRVKARTGSTSTWFYGAPKKAFKYMENWPLTVTQAGANSEAEFTHDVVARYKVSERGAFAVVEPRYMVKATA